MGREHPYQFWAKTSQDGSWLPLTSHCLDVALVFRALCDVPGMRRSLEWVAGCSLSSGQLDRLAVLALFHDVGKANRGFQRKRFDDRFRGAGHIRELAPILDPYAPDVELCQQFRERLPRGIESWFEDSPSGYSYFMAAFSHHGRPLRFKGERTGIYQQAPDWWRPDDRIRPMDAVFELSQWAERAFPGAFAAGVPELPGGPSFHHRFAGLVMLADWLGSHAGWFPVEPVDPQTRLERNREVVPQLLCAVGLDTSGFRAALAQNPAVADFSGRFGLDQPRPLQAAVDRLDPTDDQARLLIAESETGSGKTEAALNWFFKLFWHGCVDSLYFALPTRVAARELYQRVRGVVARWFPDAGSRPPVVLAVPGYSQLDELDAARVLPTEEQANREQEEESLRRRERYWAAEHPKRFLAATVAVGTVDQALLSVVQTAHAHLRSVCLDRSLLVVDEVHASDAYMSCLLKRLLDHHLGVGGWAMLLSATLGAKARHQYLGTERPPLEKARTAPYPSLTLCNGRPRPVGPSVQTEKRVDFQLIPWAFDLERVAELVAEILSGNARVLVVLNTVRRANRLLRLLEDRHDGGRAGLFRCQGIVCPHHGRFAPQDRLVLDAQVSARFGRDGPSGPLVLVGTQTLEQSLDLDADALLSDLAPMDVLLQRVGRLHRHRRRRPLRFADPRCWVLVPQASLEAALDEAGQVSARYRELGYGSVYGDLRTLELTRRLLQERGSVTIPRDNRFCVEAVTHPEALSSLRGDGEKWEQHGQNVVGKELAALVAAKTGALFSFDRYFGDCEFVEAGERVATRLGADSWQLPLDRPVLSPFGQKLTEILLPAHMVPSDVASVDQAVVEEEREVSGSGREIHLRCGDRRYRYSRFGLEAIE